MDCGRCGSWLTCPNKGGWYYDGDEVTCPECGSVNCITVDDGGEDASVYVQGWTCKHGTDDETPCPECDAEDDAADKARSAMGGERHG